MRAGVLGLVRGQFDEVTSFHETDTQDGVSFTRSLQVTGSGKLDSGGRYYTGEAAMQDVEEQTRVTISPESGNIEVSNQGETSGNHTEFVVIPGNLMAVSSGRGTFAFRLLEELHPGIQVERAELDLNAYAEKYYRGDSVNPWQVGFYGNIGEAEKGIVYGDNVFSDDEIGDVLERSRLNQLGLEYNVLDTEIKMTMTESGYVQVYNPSNLETGEFADYLLNEILEVADSK